MRAVIYETYSARQAILGADLKESERRPGINVPTDLTVLIQEIVISPAFPSWAIGSLQKAVDAAFVPARPIKVKTSALLEKGIRGGSLSGSGRD